ncbi:AIPR family protein [Microbulbifer sp. DLAB2-AF]|uniref:AIPR family protein n=1 Tax=Microbulbifer sp. DLAB2-AF TaxID=3243395 RepID=UPI004039539A
MDRITKQLLSDFLKAEEIEPTDISGDFEQFCNYSVLSNEYGKTFNVSEITVGNGSDTGIDGIAIIVNGHLISDTEEIDDLLSSNGYLDVTFIFIQAKTSSNFDTKEIHSFNFGVTDFFEESPKLTRNEDIKHFAELSEHIFNNASDFKENPKIKAYYITTGTVTNDKNINAALDSLKESLENYNLFEEIDIHLLGANELGKLYRKSKNPISSTFTFSNKVTLPDIEGINQSYYGILPYNEFKKLLIDENGNMHSIFDDNVRDFQGEKNPVNKHISETLEKNNPHLFSVLNNGIAIVANSIKTSGNTFTITDYQIVNGCQTSNVLYKHRHKKEIDDVNVPIKLIVTDNEDIKSKITVSTNNQTAIKKEQLTAMSDFQKNLEHYYSSIQGDGRLHYERRAKQYSYDRNIVKKKIITVPVQIKSFSAMFNYNPHMVTSFFGRLIKNIGEPGSNIFEQDHQFAAYYMAGLAHYRLENLFSAGTIDKQHRKAKYHMLMLVPPIASSSSLPPVNSRKKVENYCTPIINKLNNQNQCKDIFTRAAKIVDQAVNESDERQPLKSRAIINKILKTLKSASD